MSSLEHDWYPRPLPAGVEVGERTWIYSAYAFHHNRGRVRIGANCGVYNGTHFELGPQGEAQIGDFSTIVGAIIATNGRVSIGDHVFIAHEVFVAASPFAVPDEDPAGQWPDPITIGAGAWIGARAVLLAGAEIGPDAVVGAGAVVAGAVPRGATAAGNPARVSAGRWLA